MFDSLVADGQDRMLETDSFVNSLAHRILLSYRCCELEELAQPYSELFFFLPWNEQMSCVS